MDPLYWFQLTENQGITPKHHQCPNVSLWVTAEPPLINTKGNFGEKNIKLPDFYITFLEEAKKAHKAVIITFSKPLHRASYICNHLINVLGAI